MENCNLPMEVLIDILARLPVKSLMRFKCICKFFYSLIKSDNHFKHKHYEISRARCDYVIFEREIGVWPWAYRSEGIFSMVYKESDCDEIGCFDLVMPSSGSCIRKVMCIDGIFCVIANGKDGMDILIWNPSTRKIKALPPISPPHNFPSNELVEVIGFGFCNNMTGKVVIVWAYERQYKVMVCSQVGNIWGWRQINPYSHFDDFSLRYPNYDIYLKGKYYWHLYTHRGEETHLLLWFDMSDEMFGTISLPNNPPSQLGNRGLGFIRAVVSAMNDTIAFMGYREERWEIWLMKENNSGVIWHKYASFDNSGYWNPMRIWNQGRQLLICDFGVGHYDLVSIDLVTGEKKRIDNIDIHPSQYFLVYSESLKLF